MVLPNAPAGQQHLLTNVKARILAGMNRTRKVDTRNHRKVTDNFTLAGDCQRILIVQTGPDDIHRHITLRQLAIGNILHRGERVSILLF